MSDFANYNNKSFITFLNSETEQFYDNLKTSFTASLKPASLYTDINSVNNSGVTSSALSLLF